MHSTMLSERASLLPSRAIGNVLFPTYEAMIMSSLHSNDLLFVKRINFKKQKLEFNKHKMFQSYF